MNFRRFISRLMLLVLVGISFSLVGCAQRQVVGGPGVGAPHLLPPKVDPRLAAQERPNYSPRLASRPSASCGPVG